MFVRGAWVGDFFIVIWLMGVIAIIGSTRALKKCWYPGAPYRTCFFGTQITDVPAMLRLYVKIMHGEEMPSVRPWFIAVLVVIALFGVLLVGVISFAPSIGPPLHPGH